MFTKIQCIFIAVKDVEEAAKTYKDNFGVEATVISPLPHLGVKRALIRVGDAAIEFIEPLNPQEGPVAKFLQTRGEGVYHVNIEVENVESAVNFLQERGVQILGAGIKGMINQDPVNNPDPVMIHPKAGKGLMIGLKPQRAKQAKG